MVITRRNDRRLQTAPTDWVKNGDRWTVLDVADNDALVVQHTQTSRKIALPTDYVATSVELGYASTAHTAQGVSVDVTHALATGNESRQQLYTMMTRGRDANHVYLEMVGTGDEHDVTKPATVHPRTATDLLEAILARDEAPASASTMLREAGDPSVLLGQSTARYVDALYTAAATTMGQDALERLDQAAEHMIPGISQAPAWPTLRAHLTLTAASGQHPVQVLRDAVGAREIDTAADPAAVIDWRLDDTGMRNTAPGPLPWIPGTPASLAADPTWGPYLAARAQRVTDLAQEVAEHAVTAPTPAWAAQGAARPAEAVLADVAVWRAANQVEDADLRPTGPMRLSRAAATYQATLRAQIQGERSPALHEWGPLLEQVAPATRKDPFAPVLTERLAAATRAGIDAATLVRDAAGTRPLPDDHGAAALWWRVAEHLSPAVNNAAGTDHLLTSNWVPTLADKLGADRARAMQASTWWPALVTTVDRALRRGWSLDDLAGTAPAPGRDVDDAQAMTWTISTLMDDPSHLHDARDTHQESESAASPFDPDPHSVQATDEEYREHLHTITSGTPATLPADREDLADAAQVNAGLAWAAQYRRFMGPLDPTEADLDRAYDRGLQAQDSPVPVQRLAQVNAMALDFYEQQLTRGGWARGYLAERFGQDVAGHPYVHPGYAPAAWTRLLDHLRAQGVTDTELETTGLATTTKDGRLIDRFRDRVMFPITDHTNRQVLGFVARRNPATGEDTPHAGPKYLNTPGTPLFAKGHQLYGAAADLLLAGATTVLVEGPMDAHAITLASRGMYVGVAPLGTALTQDQAAQLAQLGGPVIVATDADPAGRMAAERDHWLLAQHNIPTFAAALPEGTDPADLLHKHGPDALTNAILGASPLADILMQERLTNLPADQALNPAADVLATATPASWDRTCQEIADRLGTDTDTTRRALHRAVRSWHDDPHAAAARQLDNAREVRARLQAAATQTPEQRWAPTATRIDPRLTTQQDWPALARTMQHLHDEGHDVETLARASAADEPLAPGRPAQDLRYRLAAMTPPIRPSPHVPPHDRLTRRHEDHHRIVATGHDRPGRLPR